MKKVLAAALMLGLVSGLVCPLFPETITFIHSNDIHGIYKPHKIRIKGKERLIGGMEAASHYINEVRSKDRNVFLVDTGDIMTGTLATTVKYKGVVGGVMVEFLNNLGYDVRSYGNHAFDRGQQNALGFARLAKFPTVGANIVYKESGKLFSPEPFHIFDLAGLKVGIIAVMEEIFLMEVRKDCVEGLDVLPIVPTLHAYIPVLDRQTDLIVVIAHTAFEDGIRIARNVPGIDIVLVASDDAKFSEVDGVLVKSSLGLQKTLGYLKVEVKDDKVVSHEERLIWMWADVELKPSAHVKAFVDEVDEMIGTECSQIIGEAKFDLTLNMYPAENAGFENTLGNWITDVMRWKTGAQIGLQNSGGIRADLFAGPITVADIFKVCPFMNRLVEFKLTGRQIKDVLEFDVERGRDRLQVSGLLYKYYPKDVRPFGKRVDYIEINNEILEKEGRVLFPEKVFSVVSNDYLVGQTEDKYFGFPLDNWHDTGLILNDVLQEWLEEYKIIDYKPEQRIEVIKTPN